MWTDDAGAEHEVLQAEGGEQGDPLMPALYAVAQHRALEAVAVALQPGEGLFAFLDDIYIVCSPKRVATVYGVLAAALWDHARLQLNQGKTRGWNAAGEEPPNLVALQPDPSSATGVWVGAWTLPPEQQGLVVLGAPLGTEAFVQRHLRDRRRNQDALLERIPTLGDLQSAWLLLLFCASTRANYFLRMLPPHCTAAYSREHDRAIASCFRTVLYGEEAPELPADALASAQLPLGLGGLGLRMSAICHLQLRGCNLASVSRMPGCHQPLPPHAQPQHECVRLASRRPIGVLRPRLQHLTLRTTSGVLASRALPLERARCTQRQAR